MLTGEVYWQIGLVNTAQRFAFETMEAIPNYAKSCRAVKRLAETNLVNGEYAVARKYIPLLDRDINKFMNYMIYVDGLHLGYRPRSCQEAVVFAYAQRKQRPPQGYVNDMILRQFGEVCEYLLTRWSYSQLVAFSTAWYYFMGVK